MTRKRRILFICTGNYYRSRFAEILFNRFAEEEGLDWRADSRGLDLEAGVGNIGPLSHWARQGLAARGIPFDQENRFPLLLQKADLEQSERIIALCESQHRPMLARGYPEYIDRVEYWEIPDLDRLPAEEALARIEAQVRQLVQGLAGASE